MLNTFCRRLLIPTVVVTANQEGGQLFEPLLLQATNRVMTETILERLELGRLQCGRHPMYTVQEAFDDILNDGDIEQIKVHGGQVYRSAGNWTNHATPSM